MRENPTMQTSLALLLGTPVTDPGGSVRGRLQDIAVTTGVAAGNVAALVLKTREGAKMVAARDVMQTPSSTVELREDAVLQPLLGDENFLLLQRDLMDRQIIDVHGRKVVRVNDVDLAWLPADGGEHLRVVEVEVGLRGGVRRLFKGVVPRHSLENFARRFSARVIPWEFVDVIEVDPTRRVKLKIEHELLSQMHPSDIAAILEDLAPAEREAIFVSLDEEVAAEALEEVEPRLQKSLIESLDSGRVAGIVEEMDPGAAADLLAELPDERSEAILEQMEPEERQEVEELLEFGEHSAAGRMTTEYISLHTGSTVRDAVRALREFEGDIEGVTEVYLTDEKDTLEGVVPLARLLISLPETRIAVLAEPRVISCPVDTHQDHVAELFDKYNLHALPVVNSANHLVGVVQADHVIAFLRENR
jgi:magnesium transporter